MVTYRFWTTDGVHTSGPTIVRAASVGVAAVRASAIMFDAEPGIECEFLGQSVTDAGIGPVQRFVVLLSVEDAT